MRTTVHPGGAYHCGVPVLVHVDAFTDRPFAGNPAAVVQLDQPADAAWMQAVADELQLPATAFVAPLADGWHLRWFTTTSELALCGHGTLASAHVLFERGAVPSGKVIRFMSPAGVLTARRSDGRIDLDFPAEPSVAAAPPPDLLAALGVVPVRVERNRLDYLVELESEEAVREASPDLVRLRSVPTRGVILTARSSSADADFVSRFFAPSVGIDEDSVTGSAHCCLAPYWQRSLGKAAMIGVQVSRRGGVVHVQVHGDRVRLSGQAVTVLRGELAFPAPGAPRQSAGSAS
jgi:PhzF family phenazine biosynthesis protein